MSQKRYTVSYNIQTLKVKPKRVSRIFKDKVETTKEGSNIKIDLEPEEEQLTVETDDLREAEMIAKLVRRSLNEFTRWRNVHVCTRFKDLTIEAAIARKTSEFKAILEKQKIVPEFFDDLMNQACFNFSIGHNREAFRLAFGAMERAAKFVLEHEFNDLKKDRDGIPNESIYSILKKLVKKYKVLSVDLPKFRPKIYGTFTDIRHDISHADNKYLDNQILKETEEMIDTAWSVINQLLPYIDKHKSKI